jgi:hypothetical protein
MIAISFNFNPAQPENRFMSGYHDVDKNFNKIAQSQAEFFARYNAGFKYEPKSAASIGVEDMRGQLVIYDHAFEVGANSLDVWLRGPDGAVVDNAAASLFVSRVDTNEFDQTSQGLFENGAYRFAFEIKAPGRYKITALIETGDQKGFLEKVVYAK